MANRISICAGGDKIIAHFEDGMPIETIAEKANISVDEVKSVLSEKRIKSIILKLITYYNRSVLGIACSIRYIEEIMTYVGGFKNYTRE